MVKDGCQSRLKHQGQSMRVTTQAQGTIAALACGYRRQAVVVLTACLSKWSA